METFVDQMVLVKNDDGAIAAAVAVAVAAAVVDDDNDEEEEVEEKEEETIMLRRVRTMRMRMRMAGDYKCHHHLLMWTVAGEEESFSFSTR